MWDIISPKSNCSWEPVELRILKHELANISCKCNVCEAFRGSSLHNKGTGQSNDEGVQVDHKNGLLNRYIYANPEVPKDMDADHQTNITEYFHGDKFCLNCYFIWDLLRRAKKVFKDQESEIKPDSTDKSTGKVVKFVDNSTSATITNQPMVKMPSNLTLCDYISDYSSDSLATDTSKKKCNIHERVTFLEDFPHVNAQKVKPTIMDTIQGNCFCLENYVDSIRPPMDNVF